MRSKRAMGHGGVGVDGDRDLGGDGERWGEVG